MTGNPEGTPTSSQAGFVFEAVWIDGAPFASEGGILAYAPHLLTAELLYKPDELGREEPESRFLPGPID